MFHNISWAQYAYALVFLSVLYYSYIGWRYFRPLVLKKISRDTALPLTPHELPAAGAELSAFLARAGQQQLKKEEMITAIRRILAKYPGIQTEAYKTSINKLLQLESKQYGAVYLDEAEIRQLWMD